MIIRKLYGENKMNEIINENQKISDCEEMIMKVLWDAGEDLDLIQVTEHILYLPRLIRQRFLQIFSK